MTSDKPPLTDPITVQFRESTAPRRYTPSPGDDNPAADVGFADYLRILLKRTWTLIIITAVTLALAGIYSFTHTPIYRAEALLELERDASTSINNVGEALAQGLTSGDNDAFFTQAGILRSRSLAEALVGKMRLAESDEFTSPPTNCISAAIRIGLDFTQRLLGLQTHDRCDGTARERLIKNVMDRISVKRESQSRLIRVGMEAADPVFGAQLLHEYIQLYRDQNLHKRRGASRHAGEWLKAELTSAEGKLVDSMKRYVRFTTDHGLVSMEENANHFITFFNKAAEGLVKSKEQRVQWEAFQKEGLSNLALAPGESKSEEYRAFMEKLGKLEAEYSQLREIYAEDYPKLALMQKQISYLKDKVASVEQHVVNTAVDTARSQEQLQLEAFEFAKQEAMGNNSLTVQSAVIKKEVETNEEIYKLLLQKSKEMELSNQIIGNNISVVDPPFVPVSPIKPRKALTLLVGLLLGLSGGVFTVLLMEQLDLSVHAGDDVQRKLGLPTLGIVPDVNRLKKLHAISPGRSPEFLAYDTPKSPVSEAIKNIKTSIYLSAPGRSSRIIMSAASGPREGKTFISVSLASVLSVPKKRTLLLDADLRRPRVGEIFGQPQDVGGLSTLLTRDDVKLQSVLHRAHVPGLYYMTAGPLPSNPAALLESEKMIRLLHKLRQVFDVIVIDSPPVIGFSDARILAGSVDAVVLVVRENYMPVEVIRRTITLLNTGAGNVLGVVINMARMKSSLYGLNYARYYGQYGSGKRRTLPQVKV